MQLTLIEQVRVPARQQGALEYQAVREGQMVRQGETLARIDPGSTALQQRAADLNSRIAGLEMDNDVDKRYAEKSLAVSAAQLKRAQQAAAQFSKSVSKTELDELRLVVDRSQLAIEQAARKLESADLSFQLKTAELDAVTKRLEEMEIKSPLDGMVVDLPVSEGEWVNPGDIVARVIRLDRLRIEAFVDGRKHDQSLVGKSATLKASVAAEGHEQEFAAEVVFVSPEIQPITGQVRIWAEVENADLSAATWNEGSAGDRVAVESRGVMGGWGRTKGGWGRTK